MKKMFIILIGILLFTSIATSLILAGPDTVPTYTAGRIIPVNPGPQLAL